MRNTYNFLKTIILLAALNGYTAKAQEIKKDTDVVFTKVEMAAAFPGGIDGWRRYLVHSLKYPNKAAKENIQGTVKVQMKVDSVGKVTEVKALNDPGGGLAKEAERVIKDGPNWIPAEQNGKKVNYRFVQNITFQIQ